MEIPVEISNEEYRIFITKYYSNRNWVKRIAIIALFTVAISVALLLPIHKGWDLLWLYFVVIFIALMLLFFVLPYWLAKLQMLSKLKKAGNEPVKLVFKIADKGIEIDNGLNSIFLLWQTIGKIVVINDFIILRSMSGQIYPLPLKAIEVCADANPLEFIDAYRKKPGNKKPNPIPLFFLALLCMFPFLGIAVGLTLLILGATAYKNKIVIALGIAGLLFSGYMTYNMIQSGREAMEYRKIDPETISQLTPKEYLRLFNNDPEVAFTETVNTKLRGPMADFNYRKFHGIVYRVDSACSVNRPLNNIIKETFKDIHITYDKSYRELGFNMTPILFVKEGKPDTPSQIYFNLHGDRTKTIVKNDSVAYYHSDFKNLYVQYKPTGDQELFSRATEKVNDDDERLPVEVLFFKRKRDLYFVMLSTNDKKVGLPENTLYNLVIRRK